MRTALIIVIIILLLSGGSWTSSRYLQTTTQTLETQLGSIEQSISALQWEAAQKDLSTTQQGWEKNKRWWTVLLDHQDIDNIDISLNRLEEYIKTHDAALSLGEVSALQLQVDHISDTEKLNLRNIL